MYNVPCKHLRDKMGHGQGEILNRNFNQQSKDMEKLLHLPQDNSQCLVKEIRLESQDIPHVLGRERKVTQSSCSDQVPPKYLQKDTLPERIQKEDVALAILWDMSAQLWGSLATITSYFKWPSK